MNRNTQGPCDESTYYFLRHGENIRQPVCAHTGNVDIELTPEGRQMAEDFAAFYASVPWAAVFESSTPLCRYRKALG